MNEEQKNIDSLIEKINNTELIPEEELKNMDFYELAYYMQTLNTLDEIVNEAKEVETNE